MSIKWKVYVQAIWLCFIMMDLVIMIYMFDTGDYSRSFNALAGIMFGYMCLLFLDFESVIIRPVIRVVIQYDSDPDDVRIYLED